MGWEPARGRAPAVPHPQHAGRPARPRRAAHRARLPHRALGDRPAGAGRGARSCAGCRSIPFAGFCSDPCDGRTQGTPGMFDSLPYRNDAAIVLRRLIRSLPTRRGVLGVATCDKGLPAMMMALAGLPRSALRARARRRHAAARRRARTRARSRRSARASRTGRVSLEEAAELGCRACASPGGGCQFLGTAATSQVVAEALGLSLPHSALAPSGQPVWLDMARRSARALVAPGRGASARCATS